MSYDIKPFVKWAGGKKQLLGLLRDKMPKKFNRYYEPFVGGGALLFSLQPEKAVINDINEQLINVYRQLKDSSESVIETVQEYDLSPCDKERYLQMRKKYNEKIKSRELDPECAALMIWLNKHCFNGLYRVNAQGLFNVPYNNRSEGSSAEAENLRDIGRYLNEAEAEIRQGDFEEACSEVKAEDFVYFDSPYVPESDTADFTSYTKEGFSCEDHKRLARLAKSLSEKGAYIMLSNNDTPSVRELYDGFNIEAVKVKRSINAKAEKRKGKEVIITNY